MLIKLFTAGIHAYSGVYFPESLVMSAVDSWKKQHVLKNQIGQYGICYDSLSVYANSHYSPSLDLSKITHLIRWMTYDSISKTIMGDFTFLPSSPAGITIMAANSSRGAVNSVSPYLHIIPRITYNTASLIANTMLIDRVDVCFDTSVVYQYPWAGGSTLPPINFTVIPSPINNSNDDYDRAMGILGK